MITLLAALGGFLSSLMPELLKIFLDQKDKKHELELMKLQKTIKTDQLQLQLDQLYYSAAAEEGRVLYQTFKSGIHWVDALNATVRPVLAYSFFCLYFLFKYFQYVIILDSHSNLVNHLDLLWNVDDQAIFAGIISFYFGQRALLRGRKW